jgi:hypothetical protein
LIWRSLLGPHSWCQREFFTSELRAAFKSLDSSETTTGQGKKRRACARRDRRPLLEMLMVSIDLSDVQFE